MRLSEVLAIGGLGCVVYLWTYPWYANHPSPKTACLSNLHQQVLALTMYADDGDQGFPERDAWMDRLKPYLKEETDFHEPGPNWKTHYGYAFNAALSRAKVPSSSEAVPLVYDSVDPVRNASDPFASLPKPGRHEGRDNVAYADGHARSVKP